MSQPSKLVWAGSLAATALVVAVGTWMLTDRTEPASLGEPVAVVETTATDGAAADVTPTTETSTPSWLFSATAGAGTWTEQPDGTTTLTLTDVDPEITGFTDRPDRDTVVIAGSKLVDAWPTLFADSAPNAVLVTRDASGRAASYVLTISAPSVDGTSMSFTAEVVEGKDHSSQVPGMTSAPATPPPAAFEGVSLFIDDVSPSDGVFSCKNGNGQVISPPGTVPLIYKPMAPFVKLCQDAGGTVTPKPPS